MVKKLEEELKNLNTENDQIDGQIDEFGAQLSEVEKAVDEQKAKLGTLKSEKESLEVAG
jgi:septal ring factor EnvC (AmiA/AmiB activator)